MNCETLQLPAVKADLCAPNVNYAQVDAIYIGTGDNPFTDWESLTEWLARVDNVDVTDPTKLRKFHVIGDKPAAEKNKIDFSQNRSIYSTPKHTINVRIDETGDENYAFLRWLEQNPGHTLKMWYQFGKYIKGGNSGIDCTLNLDDIIEGDNKALNVFGGALSWEGIHAERILNPMA